MPAAAAIMRAAGGKFTEAEVANLSGEQCEERDSLYGRSMPLAKATLAIQDQV
jgi:hypothetical protein